METKINIDGIFSQLIKKIVNGIEEIEMINKLPNLVISNIKSLAREMQQEIISNIDDIALDIEDTGSSVMLDIIYDKYKLKFNCLGDLYSRLSLNEVERRLFFAYKSIIDNIDIIKELEKDE